VLVEQHVNVRPGIEDLANRPCAYPVPHSGAKPVRHPLLECCGAVADERAAQTVKLLRHPLRRPVGGAVDRDDAADHVRRTQRRFDRVGRADRVAHQHRGVKLKRCAQVEQVLRIASDRVSVSRAAGSSAATLVQHHDAMVICEFCKLGVPRPGTRTPAAGENERGARANVLVVDLCLV